MIKKTLLSILFTILITSTGFAVEKDQVIIDRVYELLNKNSYTLGDKELQKNSVEDMLKQIDDEHAHLFTTEEADAAQDNLNGKFIGIGISFSKNEKGIKIERVFKGTPAFRANLKKDDIITHVNGEELLDISEEEFYNLILDEVGSSVILTINNEKIINIVREEIDVDEVFFYKVESDILYIRLSGFSEDIASSIQLILLTNSSRDKIILDLRYNGGGLLYEALSLVDIFIGEGTLTTVEDKNKIQTKLSATKVWFPWIKKVVVLINEGSASASELVADSLKHRINAILIGTKTFGKGSIQTIIPIGDTGTYLKYTEGNFFFHEEHRINKIGIDPDIEIILEDDKAITLYLDEVEEVDAQVMTAIKFLINIH